MIVGVDFGAPRCARDQRRKIVAIAAQPIAWRSYRIATTGMNARLLANAQLGWSATELLDELRERPARVVGFDFPFGVPHVLLRYAAFTAAAGHTTGAVLGWRAVNAFVAHRPPLTDPLGFAPFAAWRDRADRARLWAKRATDLAAGAQLPLKDRFQATFPMTLLGNALLARRWESGAYRVLPFPGGRGDGEIIEVYPRGTLRTMSLASYKTRPAESVRLAIAACIAAGIALEVDPRVPAVCHRYNSGTEDAPDHDVADAFVALCTAILHAENACRPLLTRDPSRPEPTLQAWEGAI